MDDILNLIKCEARKEKTNIKFYFQNELESGKPSEAVRAQVGLKDEDFVRNVIQNVSRYNELPSESVEFQLAPLSVRQGMVWTFTLCQIFSPFASISIS